MILQILRQFHQDLTTLPVLMHGLQAAVLISIVCATLSVFVVLKRLAFIGEGIAHSALGGIALGVTLFVSGAMIEQTAGVRLGIDITTLIFCILVAWLIGWTSRRKIISEDASIGIFLVASLAFGIILISLRREYTAELFSFLFGSVLAVSTTDVVVTLLLAFFVLICVAVFYRQMFLFCLNEELAHVSGVPTGFIHYALLTLLAITIVLSIKILGVLLVAAFLVIPGATARMLTYRYRNMFLISNLVGLLAVAGGLLLSDIVSDLPSGPTIVMGQFVLFLIALVWARLRDRFFPGKQLSIIGTVIVFAWFLGILWAISASAYTPGKQAQSANVQTTVISDSDWRFFVQSLQNKEYDRLNDRIDQDPQFVELLTRKIRQLSIGKEDKTLLLDAIEATNWQSISPEIIRTLR